MSIGGGSVVGTAMVLVVPESNGFEAKVQTEVKGALAKVDGNVHVTADTKQAKASVEELGASVKQLGVTVEEQASASIAAKVQEREATSLLAAEYQKAAAAAVAGSEEQIAAAKLAAEAQRKLGIETAAVSTETKSAGGAFDLLTGKLRGVGEQNNLVAKSFNEVEKSGTGAAGAISSMGPAGLAAAAGLLAVVGLAAEGIKKLGELAAQTKVLQRTTGASAEDASRFSFVLHEVGINSDSVSASLFRFSRNIADHGDKFEKAGIQIAHYADGTTNVLGTLDNLRAKLASTADVTDRTSLLFGLLGRGALTLAPYLKLTNDQLDHFNKLAADTGHVLNQQTLDQTREFSFALRELGARASDLEISLGRKALPAVTGFVEALNIGFSYAERGVRAIASLGDSHDKAAKQTTTNRVAHDAFNAGLGFVTGGVSLAVVGLSKLGDSHDKAAKKAADAKDKLVEEAAAASGLSPFMDALRASEDTAGLAGDKLATEAGKLKSKMDDLGSSVGLTGEQLLAFGGGDTKAAEDGAKRVSAAMDATSASFKAAFSLVDEFSLSKLTSEDKSATTAAANLEKAEQNLADTREKQSAKTKLTVSDQIALRKAQDDVYAAQEKVNDANVVGISLLNQQAPALDKAKAALQALLPQADKLSDTQKSIVNFYESSLIQAQTFSDNIRTAIEKGYDPGLIASLLEKGPQEAAPLLQALVSDNTGTLVGLVNEAQKALDQQGFYARESARITNLAINDSSDQRNKDFKNAMAILQQEAAAGGQETADAIATKLGLGTSEVIRIAAEMGIGLAKGIGDGTEDSKGKLSDLQGKVDDLHGKTVPIDADTSAAEQKIADLNNAIDRIEYRRGLNAGTPSGGGAPGAGTSSAPPPADASSSDSSGPSLEADGGILHYYARGGREIHQAFVAGPGTPTRIFNEPETGGEAYIPLAQSKRGRSESILADVAHTFGGNYVRGGSQTFDIGGWSTSTSTVNTSTSHGFAISFHGPIVAINGDVGLGPDEIAAAANAGVVQALRSGVLGQAMESHRMSFR